MDEWKKIEFSVDLVKAAQYQLQYLKRIDELGYFYEGDILKRALYRYEKIWLPLLVSNKNDDDKLIPPLDVAWVWHVHMLFPTLYYKDCMDNYGQHFDNKLIDENEKHNLKAKSKKLWEEFSNRSYDYLEDTDSIENFETKFKYDIELASKRQKNFYYQVSLPHFKTSEFLNLALDRYKKFLNLKRVHKSLFIVPCFSIDIIWHTHQLHPKIYKQETEEILGELFEHDDSVNDRSHGSKLNTSFEKTKQFWKELYDEDFVYPGTLYRGCKPETDIFSDRTLNMSKLGIWFGKYWLKEVKLVPQVVNNNRTSQNTSFTYAIYKKNENQQPVFVYSNTIEANKTENTLNEPFLYEKCELLSNRLEFTLWIAPNPIQNTHAYRVQSHKSLVVNDDGESEEQEWKIEVTDTKNSKYLLILSWKVSSASSKFFETYVKSGQFRDIDFETFENSLMESHSINHFTYDVEKIKINGARHQVLSMKHELLFTVIVWHMANPHISGLQIHNRDCELVCVARTIASEQLPKQSLNKKFITLDLTNERCMLVNNIDGDYALIKGRWVKNNSHPLDKGYLHVYYYTNFDEEPVEFQVREKLPFAIQSKNKNVIVQADFVDDTITFELLKQAIEDNDTEIEFLLASVFSIAVLKYFLRPIN